MKFFYNFYNNERYLKKIIWLIPRSIYSIVVIAIIIGTIVAKKNGGSVIYQILFTVATILTCILILDIILRRLIKKYFTLRRANFYRKINSD